MKIVEKCLCHNYLNKKEILIVYYKQLKKILYQKYIKLILKDQNQVYLH
jgi:hypothetical protein